MKSKRLLYALEDINDEFIEQVAPKDKRKGKKIWLKVCAVAACIAVIIAAGIGAFSGNEQPPTELPMITLGNIFDGGMSMEAHWAYSADELINSNPWSEENSPEKLPVYKNSVYSEDIPEPNLKQMKKILLDAAKSLGIDASASDIERFEPDGLNSIYIESGDIRVELNVWMRLNIEIRSDNVLPEGYTLDFYASYDELSKTAEYLKAEYSDFLDMEEPVANISLGSYDVYGRRSFCLEFYDGAGDAAEQIKSYNFDRVGFWLDDNGVLKISRSCRVDETVGVYPIITADEALDLLLSGNYVTSVCSEFSGEEKVKKVELVYHNSTLSEMFIPYYRFYVEIESDGDMDEEFPGMKTFGTYYVPAIESEYISNMPQWDGSIN